MFKSPFSKILILIGIILPTLLSVIPFNPVLAIADPDSITIESVRVFQNLWEAGDELFIIEYDVAYGSTPTEDATDTFFAGVYDGTTLEYSRPLDYYDYNFTSIYLNSIEALDWGDPLVIKVSGNPSYFSSFTEGVNVRSFTLSAGNWIAGSSSASKSYLTTWCLSLASVFEDVWGVTLLTSTGKLNSVGIQKFNEAIPGVTSLCPGLSDVSLSYPTITGATYNPAYETQLAGQGGSRLQTAMVNLSTYFLGSANWYLLIGAVGVGLLFFILSGRIFTATGSVPLAISVSIPFIIAGAIIGLIPLSFIFAAGLGILVVFGITFILARIG